MATNDKPAAPPHATPEVMHGVGTGAGQYTEDQKRALGLDASQGAGEHDPSPEANRGGGSEGGLYDTYAKGRVEHPNVVGETAPLALGQAPVVSAVPARGSRNENEQVDMDLPNAINQSPVMRGIDEKTGEPVDAPSFEDLKPDNDKKDSVNEANAKSQARRKAIEKTED